MYVCALLVKKLRKLEEQGAIASGNELLVVPCVNHFSMVEYGQKLGVILDPFTAEVEAEITCPTSGVVFFALKKPLTTEHEVAFKVIRRLHGGCL